MSTGLITVLLAIVATAHSSPIRQLITRRTANSDASTGLGVYDGSKTTVKQHPYIAAIRVYERLRCAATIVSDQWILTTGDCIYQYDADDLDVWVGSQDAETGDEYLVKEIVMHPDYSQFTEDYEYALAKLDEKIKWSDKVQPIKLPTKPPKPNTDMVVAGWGLSSIIGSDVDGDYTLLQGHMKWLPKKSCALIFLNMGIEWTDRMACAYNKGKTTLCEGDFGDAFVNNGVFYGMFAAAYPNGFCSSQAMPLLLADVTPAVDWINKTISKKSEDD